MRASWGQMAAHRLQPIHKSFCATVSITGIISHLNQIGTNMGTMYALYIAHILGVCGFLVIQAIYQREE